MLVIIGRAQRRRDQLKDLVKNATGNTKGTNLKVADKVALEDPTRTVSRELRRSDKENCGTWTCKTSKVSECASLIMIHVQSPYFRKEWTYASRFVV
jgi:hypothetical protein